MKNLLIEIGIPTTLAAILSVAIAYIFDRPAEMLTFFKGLMLGVFVVTTIQQLRMAVIRNRKEDEE